MRSQGISPRQIADTLNEEKIPIASDYAYAKLGKVNPRQTLHLWSASRIRQIVQNPIYLGHMYLMKTTTVSYKNHKTLYRDEEDMVIIKNNHEPIITQEIWDKCREMEASVSQGKKTKTGFVAPLSGLMFCKDCGEKMRMGWSYSHYKNGGKGKKHNYFNCGNHNRFGKFACSSHYIRMNTLNSIILQDIRSMLQFVLDDEESARQQFLAHKEKYNARQTDDEQKRLHNGKLRLSELETLIPSIYEDKVIGKIPEDVCVNLLEKYQAEREELSAEVEKLEARLNSVKQDKNDVEEFIRRLKKYTNVQELTREMCLELIEYITIDACPSDKKQPREINVYYKLLNKKLENKNRLIPNETA